MRILLAASLVVVLYGFSGFSTAQAKKNKPRQPPPLALGGSTLAGPSSVALSDGASVTLLSSADVFRLCLTAANAGPGLLRIAILDGVSLGGDMFVWPGIPKTVCADGDSVRAICAGIGDCPFSWRGDAP